MTFYLFLSKLIHYLNIRAVLPQKRINFCFLLVTRKMKLGFCLLSLLLSVKKCCMKSYLNLLLWKKYTSKSSNYFTKCPSFSKVIDKIFGFVVMQRWQVFIWYVYDSFYLTDPFETKMVNNFILADGPNRAA